LFTVTKEVEEAMGIVASHSQKVLGSL